MKITCRTNVNKKSITASYEDEWRLLSKKSVQDADGFYTDYSIWENADGTEWITVFGDLDLYDPNETTSGIDDYFDNKHDALDAYDDYNGFEYTEDAIEGSNNDMKITCKRAVKASVGSVDDMINAFQERIMELQNDDVDSATDIGSCNYQDATDEYNQLEPKATVTSAQDTDTFETDILQILQEHGYDISSTEAKQEAQAAAEYYANEPSDYTAEDWYEDTVQNYPEELEDIPMI